MGYNGGSKPKEVNSVKLNLNENIRACRKKMDMTQEQLAERLGVSFQSVSRWENGVSQTKRYHTKTHAYITSKQNNFGGKIL